MPNLATIVRARQLAGSSSARATRQAAGLSLSELAELIAVDRSTLARWEQGETRPRVPAALRWLAALDQIGHALPETGSDRAAGAGS